MDIETDENRRGFLDEEGIATPEPCCAVGCDVDGYWRDDDTGEWWCARHIDGWWLS